MRGGGGARNSRSGSPLKRGCGGRCQVSGCRVIRGGLFQISAIAGTGSLHFCKQSHSFIHNLSLPPSVAGRGTIKGLAPWAGSEACLEQVMEAKAASSSRWEPGRKYFCLKADQPSSLSEWMDLAGSEDAPQDAPGLQSLTPPAGSTPPFPVGASVRPFWAPLTCAG